MLKNERLRGKGQASSPNPCPSEKGADAARMQAIRKCEAEAFYKTADYKHLRKLYRVVMAPKQISGVCTESFEPAEGTVESRCPTVC